MKRIIFLTVMLALVATLGLVSAASAASYTITVHKAFTSPGVDDTFVFEAYRDLDNDGVIDPGEPLKASLTLYGGASGVTLTGTMTVDVMGKYVIREVYTGTDWTPVDPEIVVVISCPVTVEFTNEPGGEEQEPGYIRILKVDPEGNIIALPGAQFSISPHPALDEPQLVVLDNQPGVDLDPAWGIILVEVKPFRLDTVVFTVCEVAAPAGYTPAPGCQPVGPVHEFDVVVVTFVNTTCTWGGTPGFWSSRGALNKFSMATLAGWFNDIVLASAWFEDSLASSNNAIAYSRMVVILNQVGGGTYENTVQHFQGQYLATRLNAKSGWIPLASVHDITSVSGAEAYFGFASGTLATIIATIESKADGAILSPPPAQSDVLIMKTVCDRLNNGLI